MKIIDLPEVTSVEDDQVLIVDGGGLPTSKIKAKNLNLGSSDGGGNIIANPEDQWIYHRNTYRGKFLGTVYTEEQKVAVSSGTFDDLYIGDYWTISGFDWLIADINYWLDISYETSVVDSYHLVIIPKAPLYQGRMNDSNSTAGGYSGSKMYKTGLNDAKTIIYTAFGENNVLSHPEIYSNTVNNGIATGGIYVNSKVDLMNQLMVFGSMIFPGSPGAGIIPFNYTFNKTQLSLFALNPDLINAIKNSYWLIDVVSNDAFVAMNDWGRIGAITASVNNGVRPVFGLTGGTN